MKSVWGIKPLGDVCEFQRGLTYAKTDEVEVSNSIVLRATNIDFATNLLDLNELRYINDAVVVSTSKKVKKDSLLICTASGSKSHLGKVAYIAEDYDFAFGGFMGMLTPREVLNPRFFFYLMTSGVYRGFIAALADGANINNLKFSDLQRFPVPVPPLPEQHRIVAILDEAFDGITTAKSNAERNLQHVRALFESHLQSVFTERGEGWVEKPLGEIGKIQTGSTPKTSDRSNYGNFIPFVKPGDFKSDGTLACDKDGLSNTGAKGARKVPAGSVLMVCIGATIGKCGYCDRDVTTNQQVNSLTPSDGSSSRFLYYQMRTEAFQRKVMHGAGQATLPIINKSKWSALTLWLPPTVQEQETLASKFDALIEETKRLEAIYQQKLKALDNLKKSLLHRAFNGDL